MSESGWTLDTLFTHLSGRIDDAMDRLQERLEAQNAAVDAAFLSQEKAILKREVTDAAKFVLLNELRAGVATSSEVEALEKIVSSVANRVTLIEGRSGGVAASWQVMVAAVLVAAAVVGAVVKLGG